MILVTFALADESREFARALTRENLPVRILNTGMGQARCVASLRAFLDAEPAPALVISSGFAGALDPALRVGEMVLACNFTTIEAAQLTCRRGSMTTQPALVETAAAKAALARETGAIAVDMETAHLAAECAARALPQLALRVISDAADQSMPVPNSVWMDEATQRPRPVALVIWLLLHPAALPPFIRFVRGIFEAQRTLARELVQAVKMLAPAQ